MSKLELHDVYGYLDGDCFGLWDMSNPACTTGKCLVAKHCEEKTKRGVVVQEETKIQEIVLTEEEKKLPEIAPMEYMLDLLKGRFEYSMKENDKAIAHYFLKDGKTVFTIIVSKTNGKVKLQSALCEPKVFNSLASIEEVEEILKEMVG